MSQLTKPWAAIRLQTGRFAVYRPDPSGLTYHHEGGQRREFEQHADAEALRDLLNERPRLPRTCDRATFERMTEHVRLRPATRDALRDILVKGRTWRQAAASHEITMSGILRALRRVGAANHP